MVKYTCSETRHASQISWSRDSNGKHTCNPNAFVILYDSSSATQIAAGTT